MLMFVDGLMITFEPGISLTDIVNAADTGRVSQLPHTFFNDANIVQEMVDRNFLDLWEWEWYNGRNRWQELKDRGGEVDSSWLEGGQPGPRQYSRGFAGSNPMLRQF